MKQAKSLVTMDGLLTKDRIYTVFSEMVDPAKRLHFCVADDRGVQCVYAASRFEVILAPQVAPDFRQMQQIADEVKITQPIVQEIIERVTEAAADQEKTIMQIYEETTIDTTCDLEARFNPSEPKPQIDLSDRLICPVVKEADRRKAMIDLKNSMLDGQLPAQLTARREIALQDCDANLAALLYRANDRIKELEAQLTEASKS